jgi:hypothetical protein
MFYAVQAMAEIDPARREEIDQLVQQALAGHDCETNEVDAVECGMEVFASTTHQDAEKVRNWLGV